MLKSTFSSLQVTTPMLVLQLLTPKTAKSREILRKFELIAVQGHPKLSTLAPIESTKK